jgi:hypothetical protein
MTGRMLTMPQRGQKSVSIPQYVWDYATRYYEANKEALRSRGIKSISKLITVWVEEAALVHK